MQSFLTRALWRDSLELSGERTKRLDRRRELCVTVWMVSQRCMEY
jgi:hypothetical protein